MSTPDERFLLKLYETAVKKGDPHAPIESSQIAKAERAKKTASKNMIKHLAQANLIKKIDDTIYLTKRGYSLILELLKSL